jgi:hypothetical protein
VGKDLVPRLLGEFMEKCKHAAKPWTPWPYQERALKFLLENPTSGLLLCPGMGKTSTLLAALKVLLKKKIVKRCLVVVQLTPLYEVWPAEAREWTDFHGIGVAMLHGDEKEYNLRNLTPDHQLCLCTPEGLSWLLGSKSNIEALRADMLVIDESSKFKNSQSVRFKKLRPLLSQFGRRHILTGSPRPRNYEDLFSQIFILDQGRRLGQYVTHFRNEYFYPTGFMGREWTPLPDAPERINAKVANVVLRMDGEDYLKLPTTAPPRMHRVTLPPKVLKEYEALELKMVNADFSPDKAARQAVTAASIRSKCCQIANGAVYVKELSGESEFIGDVGLKLSKTVVRTIHSAKTDAVVELVEELQGEPLLLAIGFKHDVTALRAALRYDVPVIHGGTPHRQRLEWLTKWNRGELPVLLGHPASMGHGLNMQKCDCRHVGFFNIPDDYDHYDQFFKRVRRQGNKARFVMPHLFVARGTIDEAKLENLRKKGSGQRDFMSAMKEYARAKGLLRGL